MVVVAVPTPCRVERGPVGRLIRARIAFPAFAGSVRPVVDTVEEAVVVVPGSTLELQIGVLQLRPCCPADTVRPRIRLEAGGSRGVRDVGLVVEPGTEVGFLRGVEEDEEEKEDARPASGDVNRL